MRRTLPEHPGAGRRVGGHPTQEFTREVNLKSHAWGRVLLRRVGTGVGLGWAGGSARFWWHGPPLAMRVGARGSIPPTGVLLHRANINVLRVLKFICGKLVRRHPK